jgi:putative flippase GtrA
VNKTFPLDIGLVARFGASGVLCTVAHLGVVWLASRGLQWPLGLANAVAYALANLLSWRLQSRWTFRDRPRSGPRWIIASLALLALSALCGRVVDVLWPGAAFGWLIAVAPIVLLSFFVMRAWVFAGRVAP